MKLKQQPEDFRVEELTDVRPGAAAGAFAFYRLEKRGQGTPEAVQTLCRAWRLDPRRVRYGGLKDKHAVTVQYLTVEHGPERDYQGPYLQVRYLGKTPEPFGPRDIAANRFAIVLRAMSSEALAGVRAALEEVQRGAVANYFDDQRFGSVGRGGAFVARQLIEGNEEAALKLALAEPYAFDRPAAKAAKKLLRDRWGDWSVILPEMPRGPMQAVVSHLAQRSGDFRGAFDRLPFHLRNLYLSAYQSHLWNRVLARWFTDRFLPNRLVGVRQKAGPLPMPRELTDGERSEALQWELPLPSARLKLDGTDPCKPAVDAVLAEEGLTLSDLKLKHFREPFFSKGSRATLFVPAGLQAEEGDDELNRKRRRLLLRFDLPRGCYATMLVKRFTAVEGWEDDPSHRIPPK